MGVEFRRKLAHVAIGLGIVVLVMLGLSWALPILALLAFLLILIRKVRGIQSYLKLFDRPGARGGVNAVWYLAGASAVWLIFRNPTITVASVMILTFGDVAAYVAGKYFGHTPNPLHKRKMLEGTIAGIVVGAFAAAVFVHAGAAIAGAVAAMLVEAADVQFFRWGVNDNFLMPLVAACAIQAASL
jgi:dolichol kinase